jgi:hypothetical protein
MDHLSAFESRELRCQEQYPVNEPSGERIKLDEEKTSHKQEEEKRMAAYEIGRLWHP